MSKKSKKNKSLLVKIAILIVLFFLPIVLILNLGSTPNIDDFADVIPDIDFSFTPSEVQTNLVANTAPWKIGTTQDLQITIVDPGNVNPAFIELELGYDPRMLEVLEVGDQELWSDELLVSKEIDNNKGKVYLAVGQNVGGEYLVNNLVATITFKVIGEPDFTTITLNPSSNVTPEGSTELIPLSSSPLVVSISK